MDLKLDAETLALIKTLFTEQIPFNRLLGLQVVSLDSDQVSLRLRMREEFIGNFIRGTLHGGVISATLDVTGGLAAFLGVLQKLEGESIRQKMERLSRLGTIDLRIDYLRPGIGEFFVSKGFILRIGNKVAVTRMELHNDRQQLIAVGTGTYIVG
ncbi:MAG: thioesterase family protein [Nitrospinota bacterium]|nr:MAG: thioesterase family protein [Nitrospinota bacterium]